MLNLKLLLAFNIFQAPRMTLCMKSSKSNLKENDNCSAQLSWSCAIKFLMFPFSNQQDFEDSH